MTNEQRQVGAILHRIQLECRTFGGGNVTAGNPVSHALADSPLQFAAGVDVEDVLRIVLEITGRTDLLEAL